MTTTSEAVKAIRELAHLSQRAFGKMIGVSARRVSQVEAGAGTFRPSPLVKLCREFRTEMASLGVTPLDLYRVTSDDSRPAA